MLSDALLLQIEQKFPSGMSSSEILDAFATHGVQLSEATLRKYVQLGLLPRSTRVGQKGKHQGSKGIYPVGVVRQIVRIKQMMAESYTIEQIQREFLFMRGELEQLSVTLESVFGKLDGVVRERREESAVRIVAREVGEAKSISKDLMLRLSAIEKRLTSRTNVQSVAVS
ncbi:MAG: hypothetical protein SFV15_15160 [Polyangiaceae bacterium]|nr:hypothetical protein [Polyangiaceae bacterium]